MEKVFGHGCLSSKLKKSNSSNDVHTLIVVIFYKLDNTISYGNELISKFKHFSRNFNSQYAAQFFARRLLQNCSDRVEEYKLEVLLIHRWAFDVSNRSNALFHFFTFFRGYYVGSWVVPQVAFGACNYKKKYVRLPYIACGRGIIFFILRGCFSIQLRKSSPDTSLVKKVNCCRFQFV